MLIIIEDQKYNKYILVKLIQQFQRIKLHVLYRIHVLYMYYTEKHDKQSLNNGNYFVQVRYDKIY